MIHIKMIRHSERLDRKYPLYWLFCIGHYWSDSPLTTYGHESAREKGQQLISRDFNPKYIYTSPYNRTMATATEIKTFFPHTEMIVEPLLSEYQPWWKHTISLYPTGIPTTYDGEETGFIYPETQEKLYERVQFILNKIIQKHDDDFIIITHGGIIKAFVDILQTQFPHLLLDPGTTPYLTTISFVYDKVNNKIDERFVKLE